MNLTNECPEISNDWKGGMSAVCRLLGISWKTLDGYVKAEKIKCGYNMKGKRVFRGYDVKKLYYDL